jgi:hypothetical protein
MLSSEAPAELNRQDAKNAKLKRYDIVISQVFFFILAFLAPWHLVNRAERFQRYS